jgi:hypothetical protein
MAGAVSVSYDPPKAAEVMFTDWRSSDGGS